MTPRTPGPWRVGDAGFTVFGPKIAGAYPITVAKCLNRENSKLIAAAPDLLDACKRALYVAESWIHDQLDGTSRLEQALEELEPIRRAIAKAEGAPQ